MASPTPRTLTGSTGLDLNLLEWSREGVPLLLLHGFGNEAHIWDDFAPSVAPYYRTLALDHRGHGDSAWDPDGNYDYERLADDVEAVTAALEIDRFVLIGHSLGGRVSTFFAGRHPERLAGLVLVDIGPEIDARGSLRIRDETVANMEPVFGSLDEYARLLSLHYPAATAEAIGRMALHGSKQREDGKLVLKQDPKWRGVMQGDGADAEEFEEASIQQQWDALRKVPCPTLVVRGAASDILSPDVADRMVDDELQNGKLAVVPQAGHSVMTDNPDGFRDAVTAFVLAE
ncbi:MAG: alpha/beta hydrolase [Deltaproteobacteria bacterium]|nr:alpha/beta hydrolase [Deltaproteobacteria bacterium]MBW2359507.1 alpha/beta hydrolase [Deltaproteobacteria bacterium]